MLAKLFLGCLSLVLITLLVGVLVFNSFDQAVDSAGQTKVEFQILPKQGLDTVTSSLEEKGLVRSALALKAYLYFTRQSSLVQAGYFYLSPSQSMSAIATNLTHAISKQAKITIPEGLRHEEIANLFVDFFQKNKLKNSFNPDLFIAKTASLEGHLFPETYSLAENLSTDQAISLLTSQFDKVITEIGIPQSNLNQTLILASLIEREAGSDSERAEVAGILKNRLDGDWPLQVDATVQYVLASAKCRLRICTWWPSPLTKADLAVKSPFNTYLNPGLPPTPISNPGRASLEAATKPNLTKNWFYLHGLDGSFHPSATVEAHNTNICTYLKKDC